MICLGQPRCWTPLWTTTLSSGVELPIVLTIGQFSDGKALTELPLHQLITAWVVSIIRDPLQQAIRSNRTRNKIKFGMFQRGHPNLPVASDWMNPPPLQPYMQMYPLP